MLSVQKRQEIDTLAKSFRTAVAEGWASRMCRRGPKGNMGDAAYDVESNRKASFQNLIAQIM